MSAENIISLIIDTFYSESPFWADIVAAGVVGVLLWQVWELRKSNKLAYDPLLTVRFQRNKLLNNEPFVVIQNVGNGTAVDVKLQIIDAKTDKEIKPFNAFALQKGGGRETDVSFRKYPKVKIQGSYTNVVGISIKVTKNIFDFNELKKGL